MHITVEQNYKQLFKFSFWWNYSLLSRF